MSTPRLTFFEYEYLLEFEAKIGTARNVVQGTWTKAIYEKNSENLVHCHVPLSQPKSAMAAPERELETSVQPLKYRQEQKLTGSQFH